MKVTNLKFDRNLYGRPVRQLKSMAGKSLFGHLTWMELDSLAYMVSLQRQESAHGLKRLPGGPKTCMYSIERNRNTKVLLVGREWIDSEQEDPLEAAYRGLERLSQVERRQAVRLHNFYRFDREDGLIISVLEADYMGNPPYFQVDTSEDAENFFTGIDYVSRAYSREIVEAFLKVMFFNYEALQGSLPIFMLDSGDVIARWAAQTYEFMFVWCDDIQEVSRERLAEFLIEQIAPERLFQGTNLNGRQPDFVQLINERTAQFLAV